MKKKLIVGAFSGLLILGGAVAAGASKNDTRVEDSIHQEDKKASSNINKKKVEIETEHGQTVIKVKADDGAHQNRHSRTDDTKADDGAHQKRHSRTDDTKAVDSTHQNRHSGTDDTKADDGTRQDRHSGTDDTKADDGAHQDKHSGADDTKVDDDNK